MSQFFQIHPDNPQARLIKQAVEIIPGGVNSPVRAFKAVGGDPPVIARSREGRTFLDLRSVPAADDGVVADALRAAVPS